MGLGGHSHLVGEAGSRGELGMLPPPPLTPTPGSKDSGTGDLGDSFLACPHHSPSRQEHGVRGASMGE